MATKDLEQDRNRVDEAVAALRGCAPVLEALLWVLRHQTASRETSRSRAEECGDVAALLPTLSRACRGRRPGRQPSLSGNTRRQPKGCSLLEAYEMVSIFKQERIF